MLDNRNDKFCETFENGEDAKNAITWLNKRTEEYDTGHPTVSDTEWDRVYYDLVKFEKQNNCVYPDSPTQSIHFIKVSKLNKLIHETPMLSLDKTKDPKEIKSFIEDHAYVAMCKMDGLTCRLTYDRGFLVRAETRGDGTFGEDITHNARVVSNIPQRVPCAGRFFVDGEIICTRKIFNELFSETYNNPRNFAAGSIRLLDSQECKDRHLTFVAWESNIPEDSFKLKLNSLKDYGFTTVPTVASTNTEDVEKAIEELSTTAKELSYPIDGIVFKYDDSEYGKSLGATAHHYRNAMAFKFFDETYTSRLTDIEWTMGRTGVLTPVAIFEPIIIDGTTVTRASLHNVSVMKEILNNPYKGQQIEVYKSNMIIPQILAANKNTPADADYFSIIERCPICGELTKISDNNGIQVLKCSNPYCEGKLINRLDHFCGKKGLDVKGLSKMTLQKLIDWEWVEKPYDIFTLKDHKVEWIQKAGFGEASVTKILNAIEESKKCDLNKFIASLGIPLIGTTASKALAAHFKTWPDLMKAIQADFKFYDLPNFGIEMHKAISTFNYTESNQIYSDFMSLKVKDEESNDSSLSGLVFVITGKLQLYKNRNELKNEIESRGGKVTDSVSKNTSYLINNDIESSSAKNKKAKSLGVPIISELDFSQKF